MSKKRVTVTVDEDLIEYIEGMARRDIPSVSYLMNVLLAEFVDKEREKSKKHG